VLRFHDAREMLDTRRTCAASLRTDKNIEATTLPP
jgi:hypothetical protein